MKSIPPDPILGAGGNAWHGSDMSYTVRILRLNEKEPLPAKQLDGSFASLSEAWDAGAAEVLGCEPNQAIAAFVVS
ncbi:hypothetical protein GCM10007888_06230 [Methylobacterium oxalidis]|uniref:Uncharacterized protein n=2 Tax=Methylobacterium oxalidis TaxID=944322 RepID=A0ABQ6DET1_9HYPH|nr:hypothetical protein GCM10007888_06230 [Methylobacterium oxalidis]